MDPVAAHIAAGTIAIAFYWTALFRRKGSTPHKRAGKLFLVCLVAVAVSVGPVILSRVPEFDPGYVIKFVYLDLCLLTVGWIAFRAIRLKRDLAAFRSRTFLTLGLALFTLGLVTLAAGIAKAELLTAFFSWVGLVFGGGMVAFFRYQGPVHPNWWLSWHLNAVTMLFNAAHGTLLFVLWRWLIDSNSAEPAQLTFQLLTFAGALVLRLAYGRRHRAPLSFGGEKHAISGNRDGATTRA